MSRCILCDGPLPCLTHSQFPKGGPQNLVELLRALSEGHHQSLQQICMMQAAEKIEGLQREILRCDDACFERDKEMAGLRQRIAVLEMVIMEELDDCQYEANQMIVDGVREKHSPADEGGL